MNIFIDENIPYATEFFANLGKIHRFAGRELKAEHLTDADVLLVRSITQVNESLLAHAKNLKFVGTATIGEDHIDKSYLQNANIGFASAPGCNAISVAEYVMSAIFNTLEKQQSSLVGKKIAIVGVGNIGQALAKKLMPFDVKLLLVDPLKTGVITGENIEYTDLNYALSVADVITFHTPLTRNGQHITYHLLNENNISLVKSNALLINSSRGAVIDNQALLSHMQSRKTKPFSLVLDVWEHEPTILTELIPYCDLATPHIAGYSLEGKARGTEMLYQAVCKTLSILPTLQLTDFLPNNNVNKVSLLHFPSYQEISQLTKMIYDIEQDDRTFRLQLETVGFDMLRKNYPVRREWSSVQFNVEQISSKNQQLLQIGFAI